MSTKERKSKEPMVYRLLDHKSGVYWESYTGRTMWPTTGPIKHSLNSHNLSIDEVMRDGGKRFEIQRFKLVLDETYKG